MKRPRYLRLVRQVRSFGELLRSLSNSRNMKQTVLADAANLDRGTINKLVNGRTAPSTLQFETLWKIAKALDLKGAPLYELFVAADPSWAEVLKKLSDATAVFEGQAVSLEGAIEGEPSLDSRGKTTILEVLDSQRARVREQQRERRIEEAR